MSRVNRGWIVVVVLASAVVLVGLAKRLREQPGPTSQDRGARVEQARPDVAASGLSLERRTGSSSGELPIPKLAQGPVREAPPEGWPTESIEKYDPTQRPLDIRSKEVFEIEPRNDAWATPMEAKLSGYIQRDLDFLIPGAKVRTVECRTGACMWEISAPADQEQAAFKASRFVRWGDRCNPRGKVGEDESGIVLREYCTYSPQHRNLEAFDEEIARRRKEKIAREQERARKSSTQARLPPS